MRSTRRFAVLLAVGAALAVPVVGCGGSDDDEDSSSNAATPAATTGGGGGAGGAVDLTATDFKFDPSEPTVKSGEVSFTLKNDGQTEHSLEIEDVNGEDVEIEGDVSLGSSGTLKANLAPGSYEFYCPVGNHKEMGMTGEITVK
jgi:plastocyanin